MEMVKKTIKGAIEQDLVVCQCCGTMFTPTKEMRYTARNAKPARQALFTQLGETKEYDAFDCPQCGCQIIVGERLRPVDEAVFALGDIDEVHEWGKEDDSDAGMDEMHSSAESEESDR